MFCRFWRKTHRNDIGQNELHLILNVLTLRFLVWSLENQTNDAQIYEKLIRRQQTKKKIKTEWFW